MGMYTMYITSTYRVDSVAFYFTEYTYIFLNSFTDVEFDQLSCIDYLVHRSWSQMNSQIYIL